MLRHMRQMAPVILPLTILACGAGSSIDGKYYNSQSGEYAMELKNGKVVWAEGMLEGMTLRYEVKGDSLYLLEESENDGMTFGIEKDGTLSLGILGSLTKNRP